MKCPTCNQPVKWQDNTFRPFCSERCKLIDFGRWVNEEFRVPGAAAQGPDQPDPSAPSEAAAQEDSE